MTKIIGVFNPLQYILDSDYGLPFRDQGTVYHFSDPEVATKFDLVVFPGGPDVDPSLYGEEPHPKTFFNPERDSKLNELYTQALKHNIPMVGICGGMQFLAVMNGCKLIQDIEGHRNTTHKIWINHLTPYTIDVAGDHHQAVSRDEIFFKNVKILALDNDTNEIVEALWFPETKCLGVQYHPEWMPKDSDGYKYFQQLMNKYV